LPPLLCGFLAPELPSTEWLYGYLDYERIKVEQNVICKSMLSIRLNRMVLEHRMKPMAVRLYKGIGFQNFVPLIPQFSPNSILRGMIKRVYSEAVDSTNSKLECLHDPCNHGEDRAGVFVGKCV
jgi:hypothetical protein